MEAVEQARQYRQSSKRWVVDLDLGSFFGEVNDGLLMARVRRWESLKRARTVPLRTVLAGEGFMTK